MYRYKITFAYDGTNFSGFQIQPNKRTVEQTLKNAVNKIAKNPEPPLSVIGSGRTGAGVHALNQVAHFDCHYANASISGGHGSIYEAVALSARAS